MTPTNKQLKRALAKMFSDKISVNPDGSLYWNKHGGIFSILDTELLQLCQNARKHHGITSSLRADSTWQDQVIELASVLNMETL